MSFCAEGTWIKLRCRVCDPDCEHSGDPVREALPGVLFSRDSVRNHKPIFRREPEAHQQQQDQNCKNPTCTHIHQEGGEHREDIEPTEIRIVEATRLKIAEYEEHQ